MSNCERLCRVRAQLDDGIVIVQAVRMSFSFTTLTTSAVLILSAMHPSSTWAEESVRPPAWTSVITARVGVAMLGQQDHAPPLCCSERDKWNSFGPASALRIGYLLGPRMLISAEGSYSYHQHEDERNELRVHAPAMGVDVGLVARHGAPRVVLAAGAGLIHFAGHIDHLPYGRALQAGAHAQREPIGAWHGELHVRAGIEVPVTARLSAGVEVVATQVMISQHLLAGTATVSYWPGGR